jgi:hypothetical protein
MAKARSGGGYTSNKYHTSKSAQKVEPKARAVSPGAVDALGQAVAFKKPPLQSGPGYTPGKVPTTGVGKATTRPDTPAPGSGRTTYASGSQGTYGKVNPGEPRPGPRDILSQFGPEATGKR